MTKRVLWSWPVATLVTFADREGVATMRHESKCGRFTAVKVQRSAVNSRMNYWLLSDSQRLGSPSYFGSLTECKRAATRRAYDSLK
jgi:hypothetical protein